jgi:RHH-type proline utilization regulon transcriptional repressor/proline dehydrogenase/delta 1-pyrroline-5-carboxylate dehydrogenase
MACWVRELVRPANAIAEVREAVDFLRYYAGAGAYHFSNDSHRPLGSCGVYQPVELPLAIFSGPGGGGLGGR